MGKGLLVALVFFLFRAGFAKAMNNTLGILLFLHWWALVIIRHVNL